MKNCQEKVTAFVLDKEISRDSYVPPLAVEARRGRNVFCDKSENTLSRSPCQGENLPNLRIIYPRDGDVFLKNSDLLIKVRGENPAKISYFLNNQKLDSAIIKNLPSGKNLIRVESGNGKDEIEILVK